MKGFESAILANAFRVLGLPADAPQNAVDEAARRMRIWSDPSRVPPTSWDVAWLGPVGRARPQIEQAVARLADPRVRLRERLLWFIGPCPAAEVTEGELARIVAEAAQDGDVAAAHDHGLAALVLACRIDPLATDTDRWNQVVAVLRGVGQSEALVRRLTAIEQEGDFERRTDEQEIVDAVRQFPSLAAEVLVAAAHSAAEGDDAAAAVRVSRLLLPLDRKETGRILDRIEEVVESRCRLLAEDLQRDIRCEGKPGLYFKAQNLGVAQAGEKTFRETIYAVFQQLVELGASEADRQDRCRLPVAHAGWILGECWYWAGENERARQMFVEMKSLAAGTRMEQAIAGRLAALESELAQERRAVEMAAGMGIMDLDSQVVVTSERGAHGGTSPSRVKYNPPAARWPQASSSNGSKAGVIALLVLVSAVLRALFSTPTMPSPRNSTPSPYPDPSWAYTRRNLRQTDAVRPAPPPQETPSYELFPRTPPQRGGAGNPSPNRPPARLPDLDQVTSFFTPQARPAATRPSEPSPTQGASAPGRYTGVNLPLRPRPAAPSAPDLTGGFFKFDKEDPPKPPTN